MEKLLVSIILPVYNGEKYLRESISSILNQSYKSIELIIIEDGSTDNSLKIIKEFRKKDKRIVLIRNIRNRGLQKSLNSGLKRAKGRYIARMDADDISMPNRIMKQYLFLEKNPSIFMVGSSAILIDAQGKRIGVLKKYNNYRKIAKKLESSNPMIHPSIMFRNESNLLYREKFLSSEEYDLYLRLLTEGKRITNLPDFLIKYRVSLNSFVSTKKNQYFFFEKARHFYKQRKKFLVDEYDSFNPEFIPVSDEPNPERLHAETLILGKLQDNQMKEVRKLIFVFFKNYGFKLRFILFYFISLFPKKLINIIRRIF